MVRMIMEPMRTLSTNLHGRPEIFATGIRLSPKNALQVCTPLHRRKRSSYLQAIGSEALTSRDPQDRLVSLYRYSLKNPTQKVNDQMVRQVSRLCPDLRKLGHLDDSVLGFLNNLNVFAKQEEYQFKFRVMESWLAEETQKGHTIPAGRYEGAWELYSPEHMRNMAKYESDWHQCDFQNYQSGSMRLKSGRAPIGTVLGYDMGGTLHIDSPTGDSWLVAWKSTSSASLITQEARACVEGPVMKKFNLTFLGNGCLKLTFKAFQIFEAREVRGLCVFYGIQEKQRFVEKKEWKKETGSWVYQGPYQGTPDRDGIYR
jgi:hypothetical protein